MGVSMAALKAELPDSSLVSSLGSLEEGEAEFPGLDEKMKLPLSCSHQPRVKRHSPGEAPSERTQETGDLDPVPASSQVTSSLCALASSLIK